MYVNILYGFIDAQIMALLFTFEQANERIEIQNNKNNLLS